MLQVPNAVRKLQQGIWLAAGTAAPGFHELWEKGGSVKKHEDAGERGLRELQAELFPLRHQCATWRGLSQSSNWPVNINGAYERGGEIGWLR